MIMKHLITFFLVLTCVFISCSVDKIEKHEVEEALMESVHISSNDVISVDGEFQLSLTLDEAIDRGISEAEYSQFQNDLQLFNDFNNRLFLDVLAPSEGYIYVEITFGSLFYYSSIEGPDYQYVGPLGDGSYVISYMFSSNEYVEHNLGIYWNGNGHNVTEFTDSAFGYSHEDNAGGILELTYECDDDWYTGVCAWRLYMKVPVSFE